MPHGSLAQFKATLARKKERTIKQERKFDAGSIYYKEKNNPPEYGFPKLSEQGLEKLKKEIREKLKKERKFLRLKIAFVFIILLVLLVFLLST